MRTLLLTALLAVSPALTLAGEVCSGGGLMDGPLGLSFFEGDIGRPRRVCPRTELVLGGGVMGTDVADDLISGDGNFYATLAGGGEISGSWKFSKKGELFASIQALNFRFVQNATLTRTHLGMGWTSVGATYHGWSSGELILAMTGRLTLPTAFGYYEHAWPLALDVGLAAAYRPWSWLSVHGQLGAVASLAVGRGDPNARAALQIVAGVEYTPLDWLGLVLDLGAQMGYDATLDQLNVALGFRFRIWRGLGLELAAVLPYAGESQANLAGMLRVGYRFDR
jgi:hypothetical protein